MMLVTATDHALWGIIAHLIADWLLQNHWMATNKASLRHPAAWVHSGIHLLALLLIFPPVVALVISVTHLLIDTRLPLAMWKVLSRQTTEGPFALHVAIWSDQVAHIAVIALASVITTSQGMP